MIDVGKKKKKVLFVGHDAGPHGAQILLLNLLKWFKSHRAFPFEILLKEGGPLEADFSNVAPCNIWPKSSTMAHRLLRLGQGNDLVQRYRREIGLVYSNTITNGSILEALAPLNCPVITHIHELENYIHEIGTDNFNKIKQYSNLFIAASNAVKNNLVENHGILDEKVKVVHSFIPSDKYSDIAITRSKQEIFEELSIPNNAFVVGASGTIDWRKGTELFVQLASYINRHFPGRPIFFLWVGGKLTWEIDYDIRILGLEKVRFVTHTHNTADYYQCMDVFTLVSRIDPYPLVCLEAASLGKPVICFDRSGGMPEFIEHDSGYVVPYLGIAEMAEKIIALNDDQHLCRKLGEIGKRKVKERHELDMAGDKIRSIISDLIVV